MKTTVVHLEGIESVLSTAGVERKMCKHPGIHKVETNFMTGTATVYHDDSVTLPEIKQCVADCGYECAGEAAPEHIVKPGDPPMMMGHGGGMNMEGMVRDMRNRFYVTFLLAIPVFLYSPLFTDVFKIQLPLPFGLSNEILSFLLATPAVLYGGWVFYIGAWRGLQNRVLNMAVLVTLSVLAGYIFSVAATFFFQGEVFYEAAILLLTFVLFGHWMEMRARSGASQG